MCFAKKPNIALVLIFEKSKGNDEYTKNLVSLSLYIPYIEWRFVEYSTVIEYITKHHIPLVHRKNEITCFYINQDLHFCKWYVKRPLSNPCKLENIWSKQVQRNKN